MRSIFRNRKGQNTVEYLLILAVVVGIVLLVGILLKNKLPNVADQVITLIQNAAGSLGAGGGNQ